MKKINMVFVLFLALSMMLTACGTSEPAATEVVKAPTEAPATTEAPAATEAPVEQPPCNKWDQITVDMIDQELCVYGVATSHEGQSRIDFSPEPNTFFVIDTQHYYPEMKEGVCLYTTGKIQVFDNQIPYIDITNIKIFKCEPWMEK
jgi:hypothetical protein